MARISNNVIVVNTSNRFSNYLTGNSIDNTNFTTLSDFNRTFNELPLTVEKIVVFESAILDISTISEFSKIILGEHAQVGEIFFMVEDTFRQYFEVSLAEFESKKFLPIEITNKKLEDQLTERKAFQLKSKAELGNVYQVKRGQIEKPPEIPQSKTYITVGRSQLNPKIDKEDLILDRDINIKGISQNPERTKEDSFNFLSKKPLRKFVGNKVVIYDTGVNVYNLIKSDYSNGRKVLIIDNTLSLLFSFLVEKDKEIGNTLSLEHLYTKGVFEGSTKEYLENNELCIIRNSFVMKTSVSDKSIDDLISFIIGNYGDMFNSVYVLADDYKYIKDDSIKYVMLPGTMDNLMKFVNNFMTHIKVNKLDASKLRNNYIKLIKDPNTNLPVNGEVVKMYSKKSNLDCILIEGYLDSNELSTTYLFDIIDIELGTFEESEVKNSANRFNKFKLSDKSKHNNMQKPIRNVSSNKKPRKPKKRR